jgi:chromosome partitioning protein
MKTIAVLMQKGGSGKTTTAINLAIAFALADRATVLLDLDPQASACRIADGRGDGGPVVQDCAPARLAQTMKAAEDAGAQVCILDTPPKSEAASLAAARAADLVVVPVQPARLDLDALKETADILALARTPVLVVINRAPPTPNSKVAVQTREVIGEGYGLRTADTVMHNRIGYQHAMTLGQGVVEYEPGGAAADEIRALLAEVSQAIGI